jgi:hypothetical protein
MNIAKPFILGNKFPKVNDNTEAFWERAITLKFSSSFTGSKQIPTIWNTWINDPDEMSGILNWTLEGLHRLLKNNGFTKTKSSEETKIEFQKLSDTAGAFLDERCEHFKEGVYIKRDLYETYKEYCDDEGLECDQLSKFSTKMNSQPWIKSGRIRIEKKLEHVWIGLKVKASSEDGEEKEVGKQQQLGYVCKRTGVPPVPPVPPFILSVEKSEKKEDIISRRVEGGGTPGTGGTPLQLTEESDPNFLWRKVPAAELCELCGKSSVEFEINGIRRCESCFNAIRLKFSKAVWKEVGQETSQ